MRSGDVVPELKRRQHRQQMAFVEDHVTPQTMFERPEQPFDIAVFPRPRRTGMTQAYAAPPQRLPDQTAAEHRMIVRLDRLGPAELADGQQQATEKSPPVEPPEPSQYQVEPTAVIDRAEHDVLDATGVRDARSVDPPHAIARQARRHTMLQFTLAVQRRMRFPDQQLAHPSAPHRHTRLGQDHY